jgi:sporulation protein YlmC with PRC-barrel domain
MRSTHLAHDLSGLALLARDGGVGHVHDLYVDDRRWNVRYLVVDVRRGMSSRRILVSPVSVTAVDVHGGRAEVSLTREQLWHGPDVNTDRPVSRQHEIALHEYYGIPFYWTAEDPAAEHAGDLHLRSVRAVRGYTVIAGDAALGHVDDFIIDVNSWRVTGLAVRHRRWLSGPRRALPVGAIRSVSWMGKAVYVEVSALERVDQPA